MKAAPDGGTWGGGGLENRDAACAGQSLPQAELFVRQRVRPGLPSQAVAWPPRLSAGRRESGSQGPWLGEAAPQPEGNSVCAQQAPTRLGFPGALPQRRVVWMWFGALPGACLQSFPASGSFPMTRFFTSGGQSTGVSNSASALPVNIQD